MIENITLDLELEKNELRGVGSRNVEKASYEGSMEFTIEDDGSLKNFARMSDIPIVFVDAPSIGWERKPFIPTDNL